MIEDSGKHTCTKNKRVLCVRSFSFELKGIYHCWESRDTQCL